MFKRRILLLGLVMLVLGSSQAYASFMSQTVTADWIFPTFGTVLESHDVVVGAGVELPASAISSDWKFDIDIGEDFILFSFNSMSYWQDEDANGWMFTDTYGTIPDIIGYSISEISSGISGLSAGDLDFTSESVFGNFGTGSYLTVAGEGDFIKFDVQFAEPVPEPATMFLLGSGILGFVAFRKRFRKR